MRSGVRHARSASIADSEGCGHSPVASWRARRSSGGRVGRMATVAYPIRAPPSTRGRVDRARGTVLYRPAMEQARVLAASRRMFIDGKWVEASNGATYPIPNPATEDEVGSAPDATVEDMQRAIGAARRAFDEGPWPSSSRQERARALDTIADA